MTQPYMRTFTGRKFYPLDPRPEDVDIRDIAHALAMKCRYGGHSRIFYSVAEHSVYIYRNAKREHRYQALMADSGETYFPDIISPIKHSPEWEAFFRPMEHAVEAAIFTALHVPTPFPPEIKQLDTRILSNEMPVLMPSPEDWWVTAEGQLVPAGTGFGSWKHGAPLDIDPRKMGWSPEVAEAEFMRAFRESVYGH